MKIVCSRESLLNSFVIASSVIKPNNAKAILTNIKIESSADGTVLQAGDSEIRLRVNLTDVEVEEPGAALLPTARVRSVLSESKAETIRIETNGSNLNLISGGFEERTLLYFVKRMTTEQVVVVPAVRVSAGVTLPKK